MRISFIGAGKVGKALGLYFQLNGLIVQGYFSKTIESAEEAAGLTHSQVFRSLKDLVLNSDLIFITTNDNAIPEIVSQLVLTGCMQAQQLIAHASGVLSSQVLKPLEEIGCNVYAIHPLQAFKEPLLACQSLKTTCFTLEGTPAKMDVIQALFKKTNNPVLRIQADHKTLYHAGACIISNYLVTLMDLGFRFFEQAGMQPNEIYGAVSPLIMGTLQNIQNSGPGNALTGPIARGDTLTIRKHLEEISEKMPSELALYRLLGLKTLEMIGDQQNNNHEQLKQLLEEK